MQVIWKLQIPIADEFIIELPEQSKILSFQFQDKLPCIWFICNPENKKESVKFYVRGTGHPVPEKSAYVGSAQDIPFVWHLFLSIQSHIPVKQEENIDAA